MGEGEGGMFRENSIIYSFSLYFQSVTVTILNNTSNIYTYVYIHTHEHMCVCTCICSNNASISLKMIWTSNLWPEELAVKTEMITRGFY